jgi:hypothetical protein
MFDERPRRIAITLSHTLEACGDIKRIERHEHIASRR